MPLYRDPNTNQNILVENPDLNPDLIAGKTLVSQNESATNPLGAITSADLQPVPSFTPVPVEETPVVNPYTSFDQQQAEAEQLGTQGQLAQQGTEDLMGLINQTLGESAYQAQQETALGIPELQKTQNDLSARLKALQNESLQIPLQLQQDATGRGVTAGGLRPIETAALRNNAIQALGVSSLLEASRGNLTLAMQQVDRAVAQKFDPIKEQIIAKQANLDLILKSPAYSNEEKNRAQKQKDIQDAKARELEKESENFKIAQAMAAGAVKNNPGNQLAMLAAQQLQALNTKDPNYLQKVYALVGQYQSDPAQAQKDLVDLEYKRSQIRAMEADSKLARDKFNEDKRQYGLEYALRAQKQVADKNAEEIKNEGANVLKENALTSAQSLLTKFTAGEGTSAVGKSNFLGSLGYGLVPGTQRADFIVQFNNLKSLLSLDNVKYLKGQGQVSDAERRLLEQASAKLDRSQSEPEFELALKDIVQALSGTGDRITVVSPDGTEGTIPASQKEEALQNGYTIK